MRNLGFVFWLTVLGLNASWAQDFRWNRLPTEPYQGKQDDICFVDSLRGWYVNGYGNIFRTRDAGKTWEKQWSQQGSFFRCIAFVDSLHGFVGTVGTDYFPNVTDTVPLYETRDGGASWKPVAYSGPYVKGLCALAVVKEPFVNHGVLGHKIHLFGVGRVGSPANFMASHDGGKTWQSQPMSAVTDGLYDIAMMNAQEGFACASVGAGLEESRGRILRTTDGGKTWTVVYTGERTYEITWKLHFPSKMVGYATLQSYNPDTTVKQQRFLKTVNGGLSWKELPLVEDFYSRSFGIGFLDEEVGWIGTLRGGYKTTDGGLSWKPERGMGQAVNKIRLHETGGRRWGYAIGVNVLKLGE